MTTADQRQDLRNLERMHPISINEMADNNKNFDAYLVELIPVVESLQDNYGGNYYNLLDSKVRLSIPELSNIDAELLKHFNYTTTGYVRSMVTKVYLDNKQKELVVNGFQELTPEIAAIIIESRETVTIYTERTKETKARLIKDATGTKFWMQPRHTRTGYVASIGDYIKLNT